MSRKEKSVDYAAELENSFSRWDYLNEHGGSDPFWSDGANMNLVRNHIIFNKGKLAEEHSLFGFPDCFYRETPPEMDSDYMARIDEIRDNARKSMQLIDSDDNLKYVREQSKMLPDKVLKALCIPAIIGYAENLRRAIANDDLLTMRRYETVFHYLEAFESAAVKLKSPDVFEKAERQIVPDDVDDDEEKEEEAVDERPQITVLTVFEQREIVQECLAEQSEEIREPEENMQLSFF